MAQRILPCSASVDIFKWISNSTKASDDMFICIDGKAILTKEFLWTEIQRLVAVQNRVALKELGHLLRVDFDTLYRVVQFYVPKCDASVLSEKKVGPQLISLDLVSR